MSENIDMAGRRFLAIFNDIEKELASVSQSIEHLTDEDLTDKNYIYLSGQLDHVQNLFDRSSVVIKELSLDPADPNFYKILEDKAKLNELYGVFHRLRVSFSNRYERLHGAPVDKDRMLELGASFAAASSDPEPEPEQEPLDPAADDMDEWDPEEERALALAEAEEQAEKEAARAERQKRLAKEAQIKQERRYEEQQRMRREEEARRRDQTGPGSAQYEAERRAEMYRQEEARQRYEQEAQMRRAREDAALADYRQRMARAESFQRLDKAHLDYSKNYNPAPSCNSAPLGYSLTGTVPLYASPSASQYYEQKNNQEIYTYLNSTSTCSSGPSTISPAFEQQMRYNMESARMDYHSARGTEREREAAHRYLQERSAYAELQQAVKRERFVYESIPNRPEPEPYRAVKAPEYTASMSPFLSFTPTGVTGRTVEDGRLGHATLEYNNPGLTVNLHYTPDSPMRVSAGYEAQLRERMESASAALNSVVANGGPESAAKLPHMVASEIKLATEAYLGFKAAKEAGTVVVTNDGGSSNPDLRMWQQQYATKSKSINISEALGSTGQYHGVNQNKVTKAATEEVSSSAFKRDSHLKRQSVAGTYFEIAGDRFQSYSSTAMMYMSRKMYQMIQSGDDDTIRTFDKGRYYAATAAHVASAIYHSHPVTSTAASAAKKANWEFNRFGELSTLDKGALSKQLNDHRKEASAIKKEIKSLTSQGSTLSSEDRARLADLRKQHSTLNSQIRKESSLSSYRRKNEASVSMAKELKTKNPGFVSIKQIDQKITQVRIDGERAIGKKFGSLSKVTDKSLGAEIKSLEASGRQMKGQIKALQAKGANLSAAERVQLQSLIEKHKLNNISLGKLKGEIKALEKLQKKGALTAAQQKRLDELLKLKKDGVPSLRRLKGMASARRDLKDKLDALKDLRKQMQDNRNAWNGAFYLLQDLMLKPILEGSETGAMGIAKGVKFVTNRHVRKFIKNSIRLTLRLGEAGIDFITHGSLRAFKESAALAKEAAKLKLNAAKAKAKKAAKKAIKNAAKKLTPPKIKTAVKKATGKLARTQKNLSDMMFNLKQWFSNTKLGKALSSLRLFGSNAKLFLQTAIKFISGLLLKIVAGFLAVFLFVGILMSAVTMFGGGTASTSTVGSPYKGVGDDEGKISLKPYVEILETKRQKWEAEIAALETAGDYDNVYTRYGTTTIYNYKEIMSMMAVKLDQKLNIEENAEVKEYLEHLFDVSHTYTVTESHWECSPGCATRKVFNIEKCDSEDGMCLLIENRECTGHLVEVDEYYCTGHIDLYVTKYVLAFDKIFTADETGVSAISGIGPGTFDSTLGGVSAKYEAGGINPGRISSGAGDHGGKSYGTWQLSSKSGSLKSFVNWLGSISRDTPNAATIHALLEGHTVASDSFDEAWMKAAADYNAAFQELQAIYIYNTFVQPFVQNVQAVYGVDLTRSKALIELAFSTSVQFGSGNTSVLGDITASMTDEQIIKTCYAYKRDNVDSLFASSSSAIRNSLKRNRFVAEEQDLLSLVGVNTPTEEENTAPAPETTEGDVYWTKDKIAIVKNIYNQDWSSLYDVYFNESYGQVADPFTDSSIEEIIVNCKKEYPELSEKREQAIRTALSLVGKVQYYWAGGHESDLKPGWNDKWGKPAPASSSPTTTYTIWGLDCSGFIRWTFMTAFGTDIYPYTAQGIRDANSPISAEEAVPGDLVNVPGDGGADVHIGMYLYTDEHGQRVFVHCGSSEGVSLTKMPSFEYYHRPSVYATNG